MNRKRTHPSRRAPEDCDREEPDQASVIRGVPVSRGFGEGWAAYLRKRIGFADVGFVRAIDTGHEVHRIEKAFSEAEASIQQLCETIEDRLSPEDEAVLNAYLMTLRDGGLKAKIIASIRQGHAAEFALKVVVLDYVNLFSGMDDPYLKERAADIEAIGEDILANLLGLDFDGPERFPERTILVATDISPTDMIRFRHENLRGIILSRGGETSHATILARSFEIPMVSGPGESSPRSGRGITCSSTARPGSIFHKPSLEIIREIQEPGGGKTSPGQSLRRPSTTSRGYLGRACRTDGGQHRSPIRSGAGGKIWRRP